MPLLSYLRDFAPSAQPAFVRKAYRRELVGELSLTFPLAVLEAGVVGIIATLLFEVGSFGLATIVAAPMFANLTSTLWARLLHGRAKAKLLGVFLSVFLAVTVAIALLPTHPDSAVLLVVLYVAARCVFAGVTTTRTVIWRANYPRHSRSRITGRLMLINTFLLAAVPVGVSYLFDQYQDDNPWLFRAVYLGSAIIGTVSVVAYAGLRVRREKVLRRDELTPTPATPLQRGGQPPQTSPQPQPPRPSALQVLRDDKHFRGYMIWQFFAGVATMAGNTAMIAFIASQVDALPDGWKIDPLGWCRFDLLTHWWIDLSDIIFIKAYMVGIFLASSSVLLFVALSIPFWAHYLDKVHVTRFRTRHGLWWIATQLTSFIVAYLAAVNALPLLGLLALILIPRICQGLVFGGGRLAWQLGHHDFADRHLAATYMAIHQTLTGIRGFIAPYLGVLLYAGWAEVAGIPSFDIFGVQTPPIDFGNLTIPAWSGIGHWVFAITFLLATIGWYGFVLLDKQVGGDGTAEKHD